MQEKSDLKAFKTPDETKKRFIRATINNENQTMQRDNDLPDLISALGTDLSSRIFTDYLDPNDRLRFGLTGATYWTFFQQNKRPARLANLIHLLIQQGLNYRLELFSVHELSDDQIDKFIWICSHPFTFNKEKIDYCAWLASDAMQTSQQLVAWRIAIFCFLTIYGVELKHPRMSHGFVTAENLPFFKSLCVIKLLKPTELLDSDIDLFIEGVSNGENQLLCEALIAARRKPISFPQMLADLADAPSTTPLSEEEEKAIGARYKNGDYPIAALYIDDRRSFKWACRILKNASVNNLESMFRIITKQDEDTLPHGSYALRLRRSFKPNTDNFLKGLMVINHFRSITFDTFRHAVSSHVSEDNFKPFMDLLFECFLRTLTDLDDAATVDVSLKRLNTENFLDLIYRLKKDNDAAAYGAAHTATSVELALRILSWHPVSFRRFTGLNADYDMMRTCLDDPMIATINQALIFEARVQNMQRNPLEVLPPLNLKRITQLSSALRPNSQLWKLHHDSLQNALVSEWPGGLSRGVEFLLDRLVRVTRSQEAIDRMNSLLPVPAMSLAKLAKKEWHFNQNGEFLTELDLLLMLPRPIFDDVLAILRETPLTDISNHPYCRIPVLESSSASLFATREQREVALLAFNPVVKSDEVANSTPRPT